MLRKGVADLNKAMRKKFIVKIDEKKELTKPRPSSMLIVTDNSYSKVYDEAKTEWELESAVDETSEDFTNVCELCKNPHLKCNFVIHNPNTNRRLRVGSTCIIRFGLIQGNVDFETGALLINNFIDEQHHLFEVRSHVKGVMVWTPRADEFKVFYENLKKYLALKGIQNPTLDQLGEICYGDRWNEFKTDRLIPYRLRAIWDNPGSIETIKTKAKKDKQIKEGSTWTGKRRRGAFITDTFGRSSEYNVEKHVTNKEKK